MPPTLVALEYVVDDLDRALELLVDLLGFEVVDRADHPSLDAEMVTVDIGPVAVTLLHPTAAGDRRALSPPACNLSQLVFTTDEPLTELTDRLAERGTGVVVDGAAMAHLSAQTTASVFGVAPALVFTSPSAGDAP